MANTKINFVSAVKTVNEEVYNEACTAAFTVIASIIIFISIFIISKGIFALFTFMAAFVFVFREANRDRTNSGGITYVKFVIKFIPHVVKSIFTLKVLECIDLNKLAVLIARIIYAFTIVLGGVVVFMTIAAVMVIA